jgi:hypothetical protein
LERRAVLAQVLAYFETHAASRFGELHGPADTRIDRRAESSGRVGLSKMALHRATV